MKRPRAQHLIDGTVQQRLNVLEALIDGEYGGKLKTFEEKTGIKMAQVSQWFTGYRALRDKALRRLEEATQKPFGFFDYRTLIAGSGQLTVTGYPAALTVAALIDSSASGLQIPLLANSASMGPGADGIAEDVIQGTLTVSPDWVAQNVRSTRSDALRFIHGHGDSMAPTFNSGDVLLVDTGVQDVKVDGVYVLRAHDRLFIKRVRQRLDGAHEISSDNPNHKTVDTLNGDHSVEILGRVVWAWNGKKM